MIVAVNSDGAVRLRSLPVSRHSIPVNHVLPVLASFSAQRFAIVQLGMPEIGLITRLLSRRCSDAGTDQLYCFCP